MLCPNLSSPQWKALVERLGETEAWREFLKYGEIPSEDIYKSIKTKTTEEIAEGINKSLIQTSLEIKYTSFIQSALLNQLGDLTPNAKLSTPPSKAFNQIKTIFDTVQKEVTDALTLVQSESDFKEVISSKEFKSGELTKAYPIFEHIKDYNDLGKALTTYTELSTNFEKYRDIVVTELAQKGIKLSKDTLIANASTDPVQNDNDVNDDISVSENELGEQFKDGYVFQTNPRDTASVRVRLLLESIKTGESELGLPLYADPEDVLADMLFVGSKMKLAGFTGVETKYSSFKKELEDRAEGRPYLKNLIAKLDKFVLDNKWDVLNDILTFATKAYANEGLILYKLKRFGNEISSTTDVKVTTTNQDTVQSQVAKDWSAKNESTVAGFFNVSSIYEKTPNPTKVAELGNILEKAAQKDSDKVSLFKEFFSILGINFTDEDLAYITPRLGKAIDKNLSFERLFAKNNMLYNIHQQYVNNMSVPFEGQYGFQNERRTMSKLAMLYYEANPSRYNIVSSRTSDNKSKYLYIQPSYVENAKRVWQNDVESEGKTSNHKLHNSAFAAPNLEFWKEVKNGNITFNLDYFSGIREQGTSRVGKVRKSLSSKEQAVAMLLGHQENMTTGSYLSFTLSDKSATIQTKMTKTFFVDGKNIPVGLSKDFTLVEKKVKYTESFRNRLYNTFVTPEISRIQKAIESPDVNLESFDIASKLFYIIPSLNTDERLEKFREDLYAGKPVDFYKEIVAQVVLEEMSQSAETQLQDFIKAGIISVNDKDAYSFPLFNVKYVSRFKESKVKGKELALLMMMDLKANYMNAQVKNLQFLSADPMLFFKKHKGFTTTSFNDISAEDKLKLVSATWDEFSKRAAGFIAPGSQGNWTWKDTKGKEYSSQTYNAVTAQDVKVGKSEITDAQEFVTLQEHIDFLMSEGGIPSKVWEKITSKIAKAKPGGYYELTSTELNYVFNPSKPVYFNVGIEKNGLNRLDYVKSSRYPLIPQHEAGSERDKLRIWMEKNKINSVSFVSAKKLGRPKDAVSLFDKDGNFVEPTAKQTKIATQVLSREGLRTQQEIPDQKEMIATISQMNRTLFDGLLTESFTINGKKMSGLAAKHLKEDVRSRLFELKSLELSDKLGNINNDHRGLYQLLKDVILTDTTGSYSINDLKALEIDPMTNKFKKSLELQFKSEKFQSMINSLVNKTVMLKTDGTSFIQVSGVGAKYTLDQLGKGIQSDIIWTSSFDKSVKKGQSAKLGYIKNENGKITAAQAIVSQYITDLDGNVIDLADFIIEKDGRKILDMSKIDPKLLQLAASRIPNQSHPSMLPIEVIGFLPSYMKNTMIVPDGITAQMGSDFDVDKLFAYMSKALVNRDADGKITNLSTLDVSLTADTNLNSLSEAELNQLYRDIHWSVLTNPATFAKITGSVDMDDISHINTTRESLLKKYNIPTEQGITLPLDFTTSIKKYNDNRSSKDGVGIYANYSSAQADFQSIELKLGYTTEDEEPVENPIKVKFSKKDIVASDLLYIGRQGSSVSSLGQRRTIGDNINMKFTESVDNVKNQNLHKFNWTDKAMGPIGAFDLLTDNKGNAVPIDFTTNLTSQKIIETYFDYIDQRRDSFGQFESNAQAASEALLKEQLASRIAKYYKGSLDPKEYLSDASRDNVLDPETLQDTWLIGKAMDAPEETREDILSQLAKDLKFKNVDAMMLKYYEVQYDALSLFVRLEGLSKELNTIFGSSYVYTKGIGPNVFAAKQKLTQLAKLKASSELLGIEKIAGELVTSESGLYDLDPIGEIGNSIYNSLIKVQDLYAELFPISSGKTIDELVDSLVSMQGINDKNSLSKAKYLEVYNDTFRAIKSYLYTHPDLELFQDSLQSRSQLINGKTSIGNRILEYKTTKPELSNNGFLRNIEVKIQYKDGDAHTISFRSPFGSDINSKKAITGFYELALSEDAEVRQLAKDLAIYPFLTGDAGNIGRFIPVDYYMSDEDFSKAIGNLYKAYAKTFLSDVSNREVFLTQVVQNNADTYSKSYRFSSNVAADGQTTTSLFKRILQQKNILGPNTGSLAKVNTFRITRGDIETFNDDKAKAVADSFKVPVTALDRMLYGEDAKGVEDKYPDYISIDDVATYNIGAIPDADVKYLYKRTSSVNDPVATYTRIPILGYGNIKEYDFSNKALISGVAKNNVDNVNSKVTTGEIVNQKAAVMPEEPFVSSDVTTVSSPAPVRVAAEPADESVAKTPAAFTNHSGGAYGGDTFWDVIGREFGVVDHRHYRDAANTGLSKQLKDSGVKATVLTKQQMDTARAEIKRLLGKEYADDVQGNLQVRNYYQVANADAVYAIAQLNGDATFNAGSVLGGTNTAVQLGIKLNKPTYVWDISSEQWFKYVPKNTNGSEVGEFVSTETPTLTKNFAGVGSRDIENYNTKDKDGKWMPRKQYVGAEKEAAAKQAIREVYAKTFGQPQVESKTIEERLAALKQKGISIVKAKDGTYDVLQDEDGVIGEYYNSLEEAVADMERFEMGRPYVDTIVEEEPTYEKVKYGDKEYIFEDGTYFNIKAGSKGADVKDKNLETKLRLTRAVEKNPERVVKIKVGPTESSYYVVDNRIFSLQPTSFGKEIVSEDIRNRVFNVNDAKIEDKPVEKTQPELPTVEPDLTFTYNGVSVKTEFPLSSEQSDALKKLIDFVEKGTPTGNEVYDNTYTLEGYAGTGKTSIIGILDRYIKSKVKHTSFIYMAPTHAATVALGLNVVKYGSTDLPMTVASALLESKDQRTGLPVVKFTKKFNDRVKGIKTVIVLDEASMLANESFTKLIKAAKSSGHAVIFMGDPKQIPEVTPNATSKNLGKAFDNPNKSQLVTVFRTKDNNILNLLTNIRNNTQFKEYTFENTDRLKQLSRGEYNKEVISDLQNNLEDTMIINYSNAGVAKANQAARSVLNFEGELKPSEKIVGYSGSQTKQVERGDLANSVSYIVEEVKKTEEGPVLLKTKSKVLEHLSKMGITGIRQSSTNTYLQLSENDTFVFNLTKEQLAYNREVLRKTLSTINDLNNAYKNKQIGYNDYVYQVYLVRDSLASVNTGNDYIYNPNTDSVESYDKLKHKGINQNLLIEKGLDFGYAVTIHKSQGMTIPNVYFDTASLQVVPKIDIMRDGALFNTEKNALYYVAMSRASNKLVIPTNDAATLPESSARPKPKSADEQLIDFEMIAEQINIDGILTAEVPKMFGVTSGSADYKTVLNNIYKTGSPFNKALIQMLAKSKMKPVSIVLNNDASDPGLYSPVTNTITINPKLAIGTTEVMEKGVERLQEVILHELLHHVTVDMLKADPATLTAEQRKWVVSVKNTFNDVQKKMLADPKHAAALQKAIDQTNLEDGYLSESDKSLYYGLTNVFDFVSMLMTDKGFQEFMNNTPYTGNKNVFERFLEILSNLLKEMGIAIKDNSVLKEGVGGIVGLIQANTEAAPVQKSIRTKSYKQQMIEDSLSDIITSLDIKTKC